MVGSSRNSSSGSPASADRNVEPALLAARQLVHAHVRFLLEADDLDHLVDVAGVRVVAGVELDDLAHGEVGLDAGRLQDDPDALAQARLALRRVVAENVDLAGGPLPEALEDLDGRRLARAVRSEEREDLAAMDVEVDPSTASRSP